VKRARAGGEGRTPANTLSPSRHALSAITENADTSLVTQGLVGDKLCLVTVDILRAYDVSVDTGRQTLRLPDEMVLLWSPRARLLPSRLVVAKDQVVPSQCEGIVASRRRWPDRTDATSPSA
jgi:hypothetical protein